MNLTTSQQSMLRGDHGPAVQKSMQILAALGKIYGAKEMVPVTSVQVSGVSYDNLGDAGLEFLSALAGGGGQARVRATLNPAGMDVQNWPAMGISEDFARAQQRVIAAFTRMGIEATCTCTPYLAGNLPQAGDHIAWAESSAVCYANSVLGARTNREGGPSALAAALTGFTPSCGFHLDENRRPGVTIEVRARLDDTHHFGALGLVVGRRIESLARKPVAFFTGLDHPGLENLKSLCASIATYGGAAMFHMQGVTPEAGSFDPPAERWLIEQYDLDQALRQLDAASSDEVDFVSLGCPHLSIDEIARLAALLQGRRVNKTFWITTSRPVRQEADRLGFSQVITAAGAIFAVDTCCVVAPIAGRFHAMATDSAKACYYAAAKNRFKTRLLSFDEVVQEALR